MIRAVVARLAPGAAPRKRRGGLAVLIVAFFATASVAFAAVPKFPALTGRVVDDAHILSPATTQKLDSELANLEARTGHQLVVATVPDLQGYEIEDYGYQLGRAWQLGRKGVNDGAILLVAPKEHKVRIEIGYGLEPVLTDALTSVILQQKVLPQFKQGHMEQGVVDGAEALIAQLSLPEDDAKAKVAQAAAQPRAQARDQSGAHLPVLLIIVVIIWLVSSLLRGGGRRGGGGLWWLPFLFLGGGRGGGWGGGGFGGGGGGGGGGFSGGGGSFGGGGSSGSW
ncbi:TPM domain-containing protein [Phenylobacterium sp.]|uniref:TPM domain-containing protein n=1 Tax=Phenylobacterium sp. TaxID=1871053 RepID=UPI0039C8FBB5